MLFVQDEFCQHVRFVGLNFQVAQGFNGRVVICQLVQPGNLEDGAR